MPIPHNADAESAVLAALLQDPSLYPRIGHKALPRLFHVPEHRLVAEAMLDCERRGYGVSPTTVRGRIDPSQLPSGWFNDLLTCPSESANVEGHLALLTDLCARRGVVVAAEKLLSAAVDGSKDPQAAWAQADAEVGSLLSEEGTEPVDAGLLMPEAIAFAERQKQNKGRYTGVATGLYNLDRLIHGFQPGSLNIFAARPSVGKTGAMVECAVHAATIGVKPLIFSLEMTKEQLALRLLCRCAGVDGSLVRNGGATADDFEKLMKATAFVERAGIYICDASTLSLSAFRAILARYIRDYGIGICFVDYAQYHARGLGETGTGRWGSQNNPVAQCSKAYKAEAKRHGIPVVALSQIGRGAEKRDEKRPTLSDLKDSGSLEEDADTVIILHRPDYYGGAVEGVSSEVEAIVAKNRLTGSTGTANLLYNRGVGSFTDSANPNADSERPQQSADEAWAYHQPPVDETVDEFGIPF